MILCCNSCKYGDYRTKCILDICEKCNVCKTNNFYNPYYVFDPQYYKHLYTVEGIENIDIVKIDDDDINTFYTYINNH